MYRKSFVANLVFAIACAALVLLSSCSKSDSTGDAQEPQVYLTGAGSSFSAPIYRQWFKDYHEKHPNVLVEYDSIGSGTGTTQFINGKIDFGASDSAMTDKEIAQVEGGVVLIPMTAGAIVLSYNLPGVNDLKLSREAYSKIFLGKIKKWNDPIIAATNPDIKLPDSDVIIIHRADGSGTTYVFTKHLSAISDEWMKGPGTGKSINWPIGIGAPQNKGVAEAVQQNPGAIGYIEYGYAINLGLSMVQLENKSGKFVAPTSQSATAALAAIQMPSDLRAWAPDPDGNDSYPIVSYTWLLCHTSYSDAKKSKTLREVITYGLTDGQSISDRLGYIPLPNSVVEKAKAAANTIK